MISVTLQFADAAEASTALARLAGVILPADRPDAGREATPLPVLPTPVAPPAADPAAVFGVAAPVLPAPAPVLAAPAPALAAPAAPPPVLPAPAPVVALPGVPTAPVPAVAPPVVTPPSAATAPTAAPAPGERDADGLPWDGRIHSAGASKNADGTWRRKRGTADTYFNEIVAQLRAAVGAVAPAPAPVVAAPAPVAAAPVPVAPVAPVAPPPAPTTPGITFGQLIMKFEAAILDRRLTQEIQAEALTPFGLTNFNQLMHSPLATQHADTVWSQRMGLPVGPLA